MWTPNQAKTLYRNWTKPLFLFLAIVQKLDRIKYTLYRPRHRSELGRIRYFFSRITTVQKLDRIRKFFYRLQHCSETGRICNLFSRFRHCTEEKTREAAIPFTDRTTTLISYSKDIESIWTMHHNNYEFMLLR